ncbi:DUF58 domain-containing protein [Panacibacter ginsenosidivorans]|uniref:DUF58 domain-containing protein n=1 Tax=Panacibacter ginsenosidivorans TaxID=1813871 RepID=A0A5B8V676_9BACT|nr:DUF58 domain-containing protein [Panacibacter ginsenosidivorans]QEC66241.1 DUF58 domain-containing protein [Panacibacter ginsenosidivorans]
MRSFIKKYIGSLFITLRLYVSIIVCIALFVLRFFFIWLGDIPFVAFIILVLAAVYDYAMLYSRQKGIFAVRTMAERLSNGDVNEIRIDIENYYAYNISLEIIDEVPHQFQKRDVLFHVQINGGEKKILRYQLRPVKRGSYEFGVINIYVKAMLALFSRRYIVGEPQNVPVYPSYLQLRKYQLMAISNRLSEIGVKKVRRMGHSMEFEQIKEYVAGDDYRTINWKATARKASLMVNNYADEKSQQLYCVIDKSRVMKMPFDGLSLLDYAINTALVISNVALMKQDKAGLLTFAENISSFLPAEKKALQMQSILETLYNQKTRYLESDYEKLYIFTRRRITQRSLILLFTNFESLTGMRRQLPYLKKIAENHLLITVFFENTELAKFIDKPSENLEEIYSKTIAENFAFEKRQIVKELNQSGILTILTAPKNLTVNALNKYLEIKARGML